MVNKGSAETLYWTIQEDKSRHFTEDQFSSKAPITSNVFKVLDTSQKPHILKSIIRPLYHPQDTEVICQELKNLKTFQGAPGIVQAAGILVSICPYLTSTSNFHLKDRDKHLVITEIVLSFYPGGSLDTVFDKLHVHKYPWRKWPLQLLNALSTLHGAGIYHLDIKPSNIVLDEDENVIIIDISGIGGMTYKWRAPETRGENETRLPHDFPDEVKRGSDIWAVGRVLSVIVGRLERLKFIAGCSMVENVHSRMGVSEAILELKRP
ncbi:kinase-like domain-containing protein [Aspergillus stella-maris]|uniref:kinase-like domain-containing protein n=1 Tax=Aspergillus stella-maris TaxID=1810926 RepID=UPI003CCD40CD